MSGLVYLRLEIPRIIGEDNPLMPRYEMSGRLANDTFIQILIEILSQINSWSCSKRRLTGRLHFQSAC